jgi:hypothetical protein
MHEIRLKFEMQSRFWQLWRRRQRSSGLWRRADMYVNTYNQVLKWRVYQASEQLTTGVVREMQDDDPVLYKLSVRPHNSVPYNV